MTARELFEEARQASWELHRHDMRYNAMERRALSLGGSSDAKVSPGGIRDRMGAVDAMVDYERMMERREAEWCAAMDAACDVLYGSDFDHGLARALTLSHAEVLDCIYLQRLSIAQTAKVVRWSPRKVVDLRREALAFVDRNGIGRTIEGIA